MPMRTGGTQLAEYPPPVSSLRVGSPGGRPRRAPRDARPDARSNPVSAQPFIGHRPLASGAEGALHINLHTVNRGGQ
jgi:hypothetical protein